MAIVGGAGLLKVEGNHGVCPNLTRLVPPAMVIVLRLLRIIRTVCCLLEPTTPETETLELRT